MSLPIPTCPEPLLTRDQAATALTERGYITSKATLATKATRGGGPTFRKFGSRPLYRLSDLLTWAESRLNPPRRSTSEADNLTEARPPVALTVSPVALAASQPRRRGQPPKRQLRQGQGSP